MIRLLAFWFVLGVGYLAMAQLSIPEKLKTEADFKAAGWIQVPATLWLEAKLKDGTEYRIYGYEWINPRTMKNEKGKEWSWQTFFSRVDLEKKHIASEMGDKEWTKTKGLVAKEKK